MRHIQSNYKVNMTIPGSSSDKVVVAGDANDVDRACGLIQNLSMAIDERLELLREAEAAVLDAQEAAYDFM